MNAGTWIGLLLVVTGLLDLVLAFVVVGPRLPETSRRAVQIALVIGAIVLLALGILDLTGTAHWGGLAGA